MTSHDEEKKKRFKNKIKKGHDEWSSRSSSCLLTRTAIIILPHNENKTHFQKEKSFKIMFFVKKIFFKCRKTKNDSGKKIESKLKTMKKTKKTRLSGTPPPTWNNHHNHHYQQHEQIT